MREQFHCEVGGDGGARKSRSIVFFLVLLAAVGGVVLAAHWPAVRAKALMLDDDQYLVENRLVQNPSWASARRFLTEVLRPSTVRGYYQPLAMISLMLDVAMGGGVDNLSQFRLTSILLHAANSLLLVVFLYLLFGRIAPAAMAGLLYGVHPVTIESVAWIAERKTLLAAFFALWCLIFYVLYVRRQKWQYGVICAVMYVLSLLSKPAVVAMPVLLVLLDFWPFRRFGRRAIFEKLPLFVIGAVFSVITFISQSGTSAVTLPGESGLVRLLLTFCHNIVFYLYNFLWPVNLSWYYAFPEPFDISHPAVLFGVIGTCVLMVLLLVSLRWTRCVLAGWLFFFVAIFPTLGIMKFTPTIAANRFAYFPMVGVLLILTSLLSWVWGGGRDGRSMVRRLVVMVFLILTGAEAVASRRYAAHWSNSVSLYEYMLSVTPDVAVLHNELGNAFKREGNMDEAMRQYTNAFQSDPNHFGAHNNLGIVLVSQGKIDEGIHHFRCAIRLCPNYGGAHKNLGIALSKQKKVDEAIYHFRKALQFAAEDANLHHNLAVMLARKGLIDEAISEFREALRIDPKHDMARIGLNAAIRSRDKSQQ